jgi:hypothetical protein
VELGEGYLEGKALIWKKETVVFGQNRNGEDMKAEDMLIPLRMADDAEVKRAEARANQVDGAAPPVQAAEAQALSDEDLSQVLDLVDGKEGPAIQRAAAAKSCTLSREVKQGLISGELLEQLVEHGQLENQDGVYRKAEVAAAV